ncbi:MAG: Hsp20/alpha crystallin family protein [Betaproteobacteria bacterium]|nr:Hsp20/alpha crystallin family protein [Betaproteobacteria bacterium]MBV9362325.1 Hsp20/alpha crystallin family protein [Betaproteobacteria bacterium]
MTEQTSNEAFLLPPVDVVEDEGGITLYADLPGVTRENLDLHVDGENLFIDGRIALEMPKEMEATHVEVTRSRYRRVFALSREFNTGKLTADLKQGVLKVRIPKAEHAKPRRIEISPA